jgi:hypothetical protein
MKIGTLRGVLLQYFAHPPFTSDPVPNDIHFFGLMMKHFEGKCF